MLAITLGSGKVFWLLPIFISLYFTLFVCKAYPNDAAIESTLEVLLILLFALNFFGDGLRDALDPKTSDN